MKNIENKLFKVHAIADKLATDLKEAEFATSNLCLPILNIDNDVLFLEVIDKNAKKLKQEDICLFTNLQESDYFVKFDFVFKMKYSCFEKYIKANHKNLISQPLSELNELEILERLQNNLADLNNSNTKIVQIDEIPKRYNSKLFNSV